MSSLLVIPLRFSLSVAALSLALALGAGHVAAALALFFGLHAGWLGVASGHGVLRMAGLRRSNRLLGTALRNEVLVGDVALIWRAYRHFLATGEHEALREQTSPLFFTELLALRVLHFGTHGKLVDMGNVDHPTVQLVETDLQPGKERIVVRVNVCGFFYGIDPASGAPCWEESAAAQTPQSVLCWRLRLHGRRWVLDGLPALKPAT